MCTGSGRVRLIFWGPDLSSTTVLSCVFYSCIAEHKFTVSILPQYFSNDNNDIVTIEGVQLGGTYDRCVKIKQIAFGVPNITSNAIFFKVLLLLVVFFACPIAVVLVMQQRCCTAGCM